MAFHPYPQLIPQVFNPGGFGPPHGLTRASPWPWVAHSVSGITHATTTPTADSLSLRLPHNRLTTPHTLTRRLILQKARHHPKALTVWRHTVSGTLSLPSRGTFHHSLTVLCTIGHQGVFRLTRWSWQIHTGFHGSRATREHAPSPHTTFTYGGLTHSANPFQGLQLAMQGNPSQRQP